MDAEPHQRLDIEAPEAKRLQLIDRLWRHLVNAHPDEILGGHVLVAARGDRLDELRRDLVDTEADDVIDALPADARVLHGLDVRGRGAMDRHAHEIVNVDVLVSDAGEVAHELRRDAVDARADDVVEREIRVAGLRQAAHVRHRHIDHGQPDDVVGREVLEAGSGHVVDERLIGREGVGAAAAALVERAAEAERAGLARPGELDVVGHVGNSGGRQARQIPKPHAEAPAAVAGAGPQVELHPRLPIVAAPGVPSVGRPFTTRSRRRRRLKSQGLLRSRNDGRPKGRREEDRQGENRGFAHFDGLGELDGPALRKGWKRHGTIAA